MQNHILLVELNRHYYFDDSKVKEKKSLVFEGLDGIYSVDMPTWLKVDSFLNDFRKIMCMSFYDKTFSEFIVFKLNFSKNGSS